MYALSVKQPFASLMVSGVKTIEWRSRPFKYRGPLVICASKSPRIKIKPDLYLVEPEKVKIYFFLEERRRKATLTADAANKWRKSFSPRPAAEKRPG
jgi:hypothetical protein